MRPRVHGLLYFLLAIAAVIVVLQILHWLPMVLQKDTLRKYGSIEEVRAKLNMKELYVPSYFPQSITWPPAEILAQAMPYPAVLMGFNRAGPQVAALIVSQAASDAFPGNVLIKFDRVTEKVPYLLQDRKALLEVGTCGSSDSCSRLAWTEGASRITLTMKSPPFELIRLAESMLR